MDLREQVAIVGEAWADSPYYADAERWTFVFWDQGTPFRTLFDRMDLTRVIEIGCGHGRHAEVCAPLSGELVLNDIHPANLDACRSRLSGQPNVSFVLGSGFDLRPIESATAIYSFDTLVFFPPELVQAYLQEAKRVLKPGGMALFHHSNYLPPPDRQGHQNPHGRNQMSLELFAEMATEAGLEVVEQRSLDWGGVAALDGLTLLAAPDEGGLRRAPSWRTRIENAFRADDVDAAVSTFREGKPEASEHLEISYRLLDFLEQRRLETACDMAGELVAAYPLRMELHQRLGGLCDAAGRQDRALEAYRHVLAHDPGDAAVASQVARLLQRLGREDEALQAIEAQQDFARCGIQHLPVWQEPPRDMGNSAPRLYVDLLERTVLNSIYEDGAIGSDRILSHDQEKREVGRDVPHQAHTMIGRRRLHHLRWAAETVLQENLPGDFIETGVWRGGACILLRGVLKANNEVARKVFVADSFQGLPPPDERYPEDKLSLFEFHMRPELAVSLERVKRNFQAYDLLDEQVVFVQGFFRDTMPSLRDRKFSILRLDGDLYSSTMDVLENLYDSVAPGGFVIIDDYGIVIDARRAVLDFRRRRSITEPMIAIDGDGAYWRKSTE